jgi:hypothetical protein
MGIISKSKQELQWQAEDDARTMARYQEIMSDTKRMNRAIKAAQQEANNLEKRASAMKAAASTKSKTKKK